jgi:hypothetical protein
VTLLRAGWPFIVGLGFLLFGLTSVATGLRSENDAGPADALRTSAIPTAIGIVLLLVSIAIGRRTRLGYLLGIGIGLLMVVAGLAAIVLEIPYLQAGGESAAFGGGFVVVAAAWSLVWLLYAWRLRKEQSAFAPTLVSADRRLAAIVAAVVIVAAGAYVGLGALQAGAVGNAIENEARARALVDGTEFEVRVVNAEITPASGGSPAVVDGLTIEIQVRSQQEYTLATAPTLCLTSLAMHEDPAYKSGPLCWGLPSPDESLRSAFARLAVPQDATTVLLELRGAGSPCPMSPGVWNAELAITPVLGSGGDAGGPLPGQYSIDATFQVGDDSAAPAQSGSTDASSGCLGGSP